MKNQFSKLVKLVKPCREQFNSFDLAGSLRLCLVFLRKPQFFFKNLSLSFDDTE